VRRLVVHSPYYAKCHYTGCGYAECRYAECRYAECRGARVRDARVKNISHNNCCVLRYTLTQINQTVIIISSCQECSYFYLFHSDHRNQSLSPSAWLSLYSVAHIIMYNLIVSKFC
jgi:hypothetical protein